MLLYSLEYMNDQTIIVLFIARHSSQKSIVIHNLWLNFFEIFFRMNVMLTRAKRGLIVIGRGDTLRHEKCDLWNQWMRHVTENNLIIDFRSPQPQSSELARGGAGRGTRRGGRGRGGARGGRDSSGRYGSGNHRDHNQVERPSSDSRGRGNQSRSGARGDSSEGWVQVRRK